MTFRYWALDKNVIPKEKRNEVSTIIVVLLFRKTLRTVEQEGNLSKAHNFLSQK